MSTRKTKKSVSSTLSQNPANFYGFDEKRDETDVAIVIENVKLWVSRGNLASFSSVLCKMLLSDNFKEKYLIEIPFNNEKLDEFIIFLRSIIPRPVLLKVSGETVETLMNKANYYDVPHLMQECSEFLINYWAIDATKVKLAMSMGCKYMRSDVINKCTTKFCENIPKWDDKCWLEMPKSLISYLYCMSYGNKTNVCNAYPCGHGYNVPQFANSAYSNAKCVSCNQIYPSEKRCGIKCTIGINGQNGCDLYLQHYCTACHAITMCTKNVAVMSGKKTDWFNN